MEMLFTISDYHAYGGRVVAMPHFVGTLAFLTSWLAWNPTFRVWSPQSKLNFFVHRRDAIGRHIAKYGTHEPLLTKWLSDYLSAAQPGLFIDVGANLGWHALHAARHHAIETVVAFEPDEFNASLLDRNRSLNGINNIVIKNCAVGAERGLARFYRYKDSNLGRHSMVTDYGYGSRIVPITTLDTAIVELGLDDRPVAVLKIDVEGYEPAVIVGASQTLKRANVVIVEYSPDLNRVSGLSTDDMIVRLCDAGLTPFVLQTTGGISCVDIDKLRAFEGQLDVIWIRTAASVNEVARVGDLLKLAAANKLVVKPI
jgi:FkbM family methyltransferase